MTVTHDCDECRAPVILAGKGAKSVTRLQYLDRYGRMQMCERVFCSPACAQRFLGGR